MFVTSFTSWLSKVNEKLSADWCFNYKYTSRCINKLWIFYPYASSIQLEALLLEPASEKLRLLTGPLRVEKGTSTVRSDSFNVFNHNTLTLFPWGSHGNVFGTQASMETTGSLKRRSFLKIARCESHINQQKLVLVFLVTSSPQNGTTIKPDFCIGPDDNIKMIILLQMTLNGSRYHSWLIAKWKLQN